MTAPAHPPMTPTIAACLVLTAIGATIVGQAWRLWHVPRGWV